MKKLIVFVPHQDDEINLVGNILSDLVRKYEVYIIYSSLDIDKKKAAVRKKEAINSCLIYGIDKNKILFLGYPDTVNKMKHHFFIDGDRSIVNKLERIINDLQPQVIIGTDFDFHSDHRMLSLALDEAIRNILIENINYNPLYLKGFCYETAYYGIEDYSASALEFTKINYDLMGNVSYKWKDRISIKSKEKDSFIFFKKAYKALKCHKSQYAVLHARSIINADNIFWIKRTDNLLIRDAQICATSGDITKINDFKVIDTDDIFTENSLNIDYSKGLWIPDKEDKEPCIIIKFNEKKIINQIVFHGNPNIKNIITCCIEIKINESTLFIKYLQPYGRPTIINIDKLITKEIFIRFLNKVSISEIEVFSYKDVYIPNLNTVFENKIFNKKNIFLDNIDKFIYKIIVILIRIQRKIRYFIKRY